MTPRPNRRTARPGRTARGLKWLVAVLALWLVVLPFAVDGTIGVLRPAETAGGSCRILRVVDGDTVNLWCARRGQVKARLLGYDSPELFSPRCLSEFARAEQAVWFLRWTLLTAGPIRLVLHDHDRYGRALVGLSAGGRDVAALMIARGLGRAYDGGPRQGWCG